MRCLSDEKRGYSNIHMNFTVPKGDAYQKIHKQGKTAQPAAAAHTAPGGKLGHPH